MAWIITSAVIALIAALMFFRVKVLLDFSGGFHFSIKYLFFTLRIKKREEGKAKKESAKAAKKVDIVGIIKTFERYSDLLKNTGASVQKRLRIDRLYIKLIIKEEDPAKTAILYGEACAVVYTAAAFLGSVIGVKRHEIIIKPLFDSGSSQAAIECEVSMHLGSAIAVGILQSAALIKTIVKENMSKKPAKDGAVK